MRALPLFVRHFKDKQLFGPGVVSVSPDPGRAKVAQKFGEMLEADPMAIMSKSRPSHDVAVAGEVIGNVRGKIVILSDDIVSTGGTLYAAAEALKVAGAREIYACATHGLFPGDALERLARSELRELVVTDTVPVDPRKRPDNLTVLTVARLLADSIWNVFSDESVSALFGDAQQLF
jgi:ribose-phosphate pyrophosphokinase